MIALLTSPTTWPEPQMAALMEKAHSKKMMFTSSITETVRAYSSDPLNQTSSESFIKRY